MKIPIYRSIKAIQKQYNTGEQPVLVMCSDLHEYVCKYKRSSGSAYKLVCELTGAFLANAWNLNIPKIALIEIHYDHWMSTRSISLSAPAFGSKIINSVIDVNTAFNKEIRISSELKEQILEIALFDLWVANEDRNWNNANLLYDMLTDSLVVIDHGCIFNTATFDYKLSLLTQNETILCSDLARTILKHIKPDEKDNILEKIKERFVSIQEKELKLIPEIMENIPSNWNVNPEVVSSKITELFDRKWMEECWDTFVEYFNENWNG
ncbi:MAG: hypothetical protein K2H60_10805 [Muribaculaceae bacterium]|nr:hypothetical protein [Muribaculaceae bacterium]